MPAATVGLLAALLTGVLLAASDGVAGTAPSTSPCKLLTKADAAAFLRVPVGTIRRRPTSSPPGMTQCSYQGQSDQLKVGVAYQDYRSPEMHRYYEAFRDHRYSGCAQGPRVGDKTCWDINPGGPRTLALFGKYQVVLLGSHGVKPKIGEAREAALMPKIYERLPS
jgi:hypothetical protein